jgi:Zn ribbon nucleic-acid-binding protein
MNLEDFGEISQDESTGKIFGSQEQLKIIGWAGSTSSRNKYYILKCEVCSLDSELYGEGYFKALKTNLNKNRFPCGCASYKLWTESQQRVRASRKAIELGHYFVDWVGTYQYSNTKMVMLCCKHGLWNTTKLQAMITIGHGCPKCAAKVSSERELYPKEHRYNQILDSAKTKGVNFIGFVGEYCGDKTKLKLKCTTHGLWETATVSNFLQGSSCPACNGQNQKQSYINIVYDSSTPVAIKFGVAQNYENRVSSQNKKSPFEVVNYVVYAFEEAERCKAAERECKNTLICGVLDKNSLPDGYTETTFLYNIDKVSSIFEKHGGKCL